MVHEQLIGIKGFYRVYITMHVLMSMEALTILRSCIYRGCGRPKMALYNFSDMFYSLYTFTAMSVNDEGIVRKVESAFANDGIVKTKKEYAERGNELISLFKAYMTQLKKDGLYNPEIEKNQVGGIENAFNESI